MNWFEIGWQNLCLEKLNKIPVGSKCLEKGCEGRHHMILRINLVGLSMGNYKNEPYNETKGATFFDQYINHNQIKS